MLAAGKDTAWLPRQCSVSARLELAQFAGVAWPTVSWPSRKLRKAAAPIADWSPAAAAVVEVSR
jgi:hypothetical protein